MRRALYALPLFAATMAFAQASVQAPAFTLPRTYALGQSPIDNVHRMRLQSCPVGMAAEQQATAATQWVVSLEDTRNPSRIPPGKMGVYVSLAAFGGQKISTARVEVSYTVPPKGVLLVDGNQSTETRTFDLSADDEPTRKLERSLLIGSGVSITRVKLLGFSYTDGSVWQTTDHAICSVRVSHLLRVAAR